MSAVEARVHYALQQFPRLRDMIALEPHILELLTLAASQECHSERWKLYEMLKQVSSTFVGWKANHLALRNEQTYNLMLEALDMLLPSPEIDTRTLRDANREAVLQRLRDAVKETFQFTIKGR